MNTRTFDTCPDCAAQIGLLHESGCDVERCPRCGFQAIGCGCIYEVCGMNPDTLERDHPDIYNNGPTEAMLEKWDETWGQRRMPWTGLWPGDAECLDYGFACYWGPPWIPCSPDHPKATPDLNRLVVECRWDQEKQKFVRPTQEDA